jgi:hypothetical protein
MIFLPINNHTVLFIMKLLVLIQLPICHNFSLGFATKARACKCASQEGSPRVTFHVPGSAKKCEKINPHTPKWTPILKIRVRNGFPNLERAIAGGQNSLDWSVPYIIGKFLEFRCLKRARMIHLDIWNTNYGQKKNRESNWQFDSRPLKLGISLISLCVGCV